jgi:hypothetical protein
VPSFRVESDCWLADFEGRPKARRVIRAPLAPFGLLALSASESERMKELPQQDPEHEDHEREHEDFDRFELHRVNQLGFRIVKAA